MNLDFLNLTITVTKIISWWYYFIEYNNITTKWFLISIKYTGLVEEGGSDEVQSRWVQGLHLGKSWDMDRVWGCVAI